MNKSLLTVASVYCTTQCMVTSIIPLKNTDKTPNQFILIAIKRWRWDRFTSSHSSHPQDLWTSYYILFLFVLLSGLQQIQSNNLNVGPWKDSMGNFECILISFSPFHSAKLKTMALSIKWVTKFISKFCCL